MKLRRLASIDVGTNTVLLLIADVNPDGSLTTVHEIQRIIRLGKNVDAQKRISAEGIYKCETVMSEFKAACSHWKCEKIMACGTSALRDAANGKDVIEAVLSSTGITIEILSGDQEALCTYRGGRLVLTKPQSKHSTLVIDIGGGSTEFIIGTENTISKKISLNIGAVRLTERFFHNDPVSPDEITAFRAAVHDLLLERLSDFNTTSPLAIGVAGTVTTLAAMAMQLSIYDPSRINGYVFERATLEHLIRSLSQKALSERKLIVGLEPERADVILAGALILDEAMEYFSIPQLIVSNYGLRYGIILRELDTR